MNKNNQTPNSWSSNWSSRGIALQNRVERYSNDGKVLKNDSCHMARLEVLLYKDRKNEKFKSLKNQSRFKVLSQEQLNYIDEQYLLIRSEFIN